jgi:hypothetical protein
MHRLQPSQDQLVVVMVVLLVVLAQVVVVVENLADEEHVAGDTHQCSTGPRSPGTMNLQYVAMVVAPTENSEIPMEMLGLLPALAMVVPPTGRSRASDQDL